MNEFSLRLTNCRLFLISLLFLVSCYKKPDIVPIDPIPVSQPTFDSLVEEFSTCRGDGVIITKGYISGNLKFHFTATPEQAFIEFKDLLGRSVIEIHLIDENILAYDVLRKQKYSREQLVSIMPILEVFSANDFRSTLWGIEPKIPSSSALEIIESMKIESEPTPHGILVHRIDATSMDKTQKMVIQFINREFGLSYPELERRMIKHG